MRDESSAPSGSAPEPATNDLARALVADQFFLVYQPAIDLRTNAFAGVEALIRWRHPTRGVIGPDEFLAELELSGQIVSVGRWALTTACHQGAEWHARGYRFRISVNISTEQLHRDEFVDDVAIALSTSRLDPDFLVLEFSHNALAEVRLADLRSLGVHVAIDDFRPDAASLAEIEKLPVDVIKLDRRFIADIANSTDAVTLVHSIVTIARSRGIQVIASGIEDVEQRRRLQIEEVSAGQGFLFSAPREAADIDRLLRDFSIFSGRPL
ncbi:MAG: EAL domain-containing protein [Acidobacteriota bacterium]|nr:EAL domain-containing protein [Acidobacteriota bacterium]